MRLTVVSFVEFAGGLLGGQWSVGTVFIFIPIFFFKQKTAYEIASCLVGSEMCIRDSY